LLEFSLFSKKESWHWLSCNYFGMMLCASNEQTQPNCPRILSEVTRSRRQQVVKDTTQCLRRIAVSAVDRTGNESELTFQDIAPKIPPAMKQ